MVLYPQGGRGTRLPEDFGGWIACTLYDGVAHATTAHKTFRRMERTAAGRDTLPRRDGPDRGPGAASMP